MATCTVESGMLFWKKACSEVAVGSCNQCGASVCGRHAAVYGDGSYVCTGCGAEVDHSDGTGTVFSFGGMSQTVSDKLSAAGEGISSVAGSWHGTDNDSGGSLDSAASDSGTGDSGGGDSGGSSGD